MRHPELGSESDPGGIWDMLERMADRATSVMRWPSVTISMAQSNRSGTIEMIHEQLAAVLVTEDEIHQARRMLDTMEEQLAGEIARFEQDIEECGLDRYDPNLQKERFLNSCREEAFGMLRQFLNTLKPDHQ